MSERLLVTQALDERDLLVKKIADKIGKAVIVDVIRNNEETVSGARIDKEAFARQAKAAYQQINDLIARFQKIDAAIVASNANTTIRTSYGEFSVAGAISLRARLRGTGVYDKRADFEGKLLEKMEKSFQAQIARLESENRDLQSTAESMRLSILGKVAASVRYY